MSEEAQYHIVLASTTGCSTPTEQRLRHLLKLALRVCGLRCIKAWVEPVTHDTVDKVDAPPAAADTTSIR